MNTITVTQIANLINKSVETYEISGPQGKRVVIGLNWRPNELPAVEAALKPFSALGTPWLIDGPMPQWLAVTVVHALHPCVVALADSKVAGGSVQISNRKAPQGAGAGELTWHISEREENVLLEYSSDNPIDATKLDGLIPPEITKGKPVWLSGRTATWAVAEIAMVYAHVAPAVYIYQPGTGYVCAITHRPDFKLGQLA